MVAVPITLYGTTEWEVERIVSIEYCIGTHSSWYHLWCLIRVKLYGFLKIIWVMYSRLIEYKQNHRLS